MSRLAALRLISRKAAAAAAAFLVVLALLGAPGPLSAQTPQAGGPQAQGVVTLDSISVEGNVRIPASTVISTLGLRPGTRVTYQDIQRGLKSLWASGQYRDLVARAEEGADDAVHLIVEVVEQDLVRRVEIQGLEHLDPTEVRDTTGLEGGQPYSPQRVSHARRYIRQKLQEEGIPFARIEENLLPIPGREGEVELVLNVEEGNRVTVAEITFRGNEAMSRDELIGALESKPEGFWWFREGRYDPDRFRTDLDENLPQFYSSRGYLDFEVLSDTLIVDPETGKARIEVTLDEGPQYRLSDFRIEGNRRFPTSQLEAYFREETENLLQTLGLGGREGETNPVFDAVAFGQATDRIRRLYNNNGYLYAQVEPIFTTHEPESDGASPTVTVGWRIDEGQPAYVNRIVVDGNDFTHERVIREQIYLLPGDIYSEERLIQSYQSISSLGFFETPMEFPTINPDPETGDVDITFHVTERQTGSINFGTAVGGGTGLTGFLGYEQPNLFGQGKSGSLRWDFGRFANNFTLSYSDPNLLQSRISGSFSLFDARDRFFRFASGQRKRTGGSARFGIPIPGSLRSRFFVGYSLSRTRYELRSNADDTSLFGRPPGTQSHLSLGVTRQTLNHPIFPTTGSRLRYDTEINGGIFGGDADFVKHTMEGTWYVPVGQLGGGQSSRPVRFALGFSLKGGAIFGDASRFPFDRFWMGGVQFGEQLRGYEETTITPQGHFGRGSPAIRDVRRLGDAFMSVSAEYAIRVNDNLSASLFYDAGNVWRDPLDVNPTRLFRGAGFGVQLVTPFGPIGLDYAYGFDKANPGWRLHFRMGPGF